MKLKNKIYQGQDKKQKNTIKQTVRGEMLNLEWRVETR
jgi:hypothetical protein